jgi:hypothetical protein
MLLVGFGNKARQGKDTIASAIKQYYVGPASVGIFKFAGALYQEVNTFLKQTPDWTIRQFRNVEGIQFPDWVQPDPNPEISDLAPYGKHPKLLQWWGTEYRRSQDTNYWVKKLFASIPVNLDIALVTDVRFPNEADGIKQQGGYNVNVQRLRLDGTPFYSEDRPVDHISETALDGYNWDYYIKGKDPVIAGRTGIAIVSGLRIKEAIG